MIPVISLLDSPNWKDYELLDCGDGQKLERFGPYTFIRPEVQALWSQALPQENWQAAHATFRSTGEESGGHWEFKKKIPEKWEMTYPLHYSSLTRGEGSGANGLRFWVQTTPGRHLGVFPECAVNWDWMAQTINQQAGAKKSPLNVLNLFGYTGLGTLAVVAAGANVTHVDASKKSVAWARENQVLSNLEDRPIRWIVDDALKFIQREARRGVRYDGIILDPPKFGRGPKGEVWEIYKSLPVLLQACRAVLSSHPLFVVLTVYAVKVSALHVGQSLQEIMMGLQGDLESGELVTREKSAGRLLSQAVFARWRTF